jgi:hypothetical protein
VGLGGGRLARFYVSLARDFVLMCVHEKGKSMVVEKLGGGRTTWPSMDPYKYPSTGGNQNTHHILEIPLAKIPFLV